MPKYWVKVSKKGSEIASFTRYRKTFPPKKKLPKKFRKLSKTELRRKYEASYRKKGYRLVTAKNAKTLEKRLVKRFAG